MAEERSVEPKVGGSHARAPEAAAPPPLAVDAAEETARRQHLETLRRRIDELDEALVRLLSARAACALEVGRAKKLLGLEIYQPSRETEVLGHVQRINPGPLNDAAIKRLFERVIDEARRLEREAEILERDRELLTRNQQMQPPEAEVPDTNRDAVERDRETAVDEHGDGDGRNE
jgi:chorismate mutase